MDDEFFSEVEKLRKAAKENECVLELLKIIDLSIHEDGYGSLVLTKDRNFLCSLEICKVAAAFVAYDLNHESNER